MIPRSEELGLGPFGPWLLAQAGLRVAAQRLEVTSTPTADVGLNEVVTGGSFINLTQRE